MLAGHLYIFFGETDISSNPFPNLSCVVHIFYCCLVRVLLVFLSAVWYAWLSLILSGFCISMAVPGDALIWDGVPFASFSLTAWAFGVTDNTWQPNSMPWRFIPMLYSLGTIVGITLNFGSPLYTQPVLCTGCVGVCWGGVSKFTVFGSEHSILSVLCGSHRTMWGVVLTLE